jgi:hypothetical protein
MVRGASSLLRTAPLLRTASLAALSMTSGCWLALASPSPIDAVEPVAAPSLPLSDAPAGCISERAGPPRPGRRRSTTIYTIGTRRVTYEDVDRALASRPAPAHELALEHHEDHVRLALLLSGLAIVAGSFSGLVVWAMHDRNSRLPLVLIAPASAGYATLISSVAVGPPGRGRRRRAIDLYNAEAIETGRCPP